ncbi:MAG: DUF4440 domain-containing protein [Ectothiorhodospiraceae bacterium]|nr:DUF4440 domain-containing protein [Ectothiorhodospiraceae bacterium]
MSTLIENFESTFSRGDTADLAEFYTDNGMLLPAGSDFIQGKQDIEAYWQLAIEMGIKNVKLDLIELEQHGDTAIEMSKYLMSSADGQVIDQGKGIAIWKCEDGVWKMHRDIWNSSIVEEV